jgi:hypothetical protein
MDKFISETSWKQAIFWFLTNFIIYGLIRYLFRETDEVFFTPETVGSVAVFAIWMSFIFARSTKKVAGITETPERESGGKDFKYYAQWYLFNGGICAFFLTLFMFVVYILFSFFTRNQGPIGTTVVKPVLVLACMFLLLTLIKIPLDRISFSTGKNAR